MVVSYANGISKPWSFLGSLDFSNENRCTTDASDTVVASSANVPPMQLRGPLPNGVYAKSLPPAMRRDVRSICILQRLLVRVGARGFARLELKGVSWR